MNSSAVQEKRTLPLALLAFALFLLGLAQFQALSLLSLSSPSSKVELTSFGSTIVAPDESLPLRARVRTESGQPIAGEAVVFAIPESELGSVRTDEHGIASMRVRPFEGEVGVVLPKRSVPMLRRWTRSESEARADSDRHPFATQATEFYVPTFEHLKLSTDGDEYAAGEAIAVTVANSLERAVWVDMLNNAGRVLKAEYLPTGSGTIEMHPPEDFRGELTVLAYDLERGGAHIAKHVHVDSQLSVCVTRVDQGLQFHAMHAESASFSMDVVPGDGGLIRQFIPQATVWTSRTATLDEYFESLRRVAKICTGVSVWLLLATIVLAVALRLTAVGMGDSRRLWGHAWQVSVLLSIAGIATVCTTPRAIAFLAATLALGIWTVSRKQGTALFRTALGLSVVTLSWALVAVHAATLLAPPGGGDRLEAALGNLAMLTLATCYGGLVALPMLVMTLKEWRREGLSKGWVVVILIGLLSLLYGNTWIACACGRMSENLGYLADISSTSSPSPLPLWEGRATLHLTTATDQVLDEHRRSWDRQQALPPIPTEARLRIRVRSGAERRRITVRLADESLEFSPDDACAADAPEDP